MGRAGQPRVQDALPQVPRLMERGEPGAERWLGVELRLVAGLVHGECMNIFSTLIYSLISVTISVIMNIFTTILIFI